ncbi:MAG: carbohydrate ABC transporter permease [Clostridia bacterium]|nr:carbohydrate ABC transporter permease [Clostridia bacterium]
MKLHIGSGGQRRTSGEKIGQAIIYLFLLLLVFCMVYPIWHVFMYSISDPIQAMDGGLFFLPRGFDTYNYRMIFKTSQIWVALRNSLAKTIVGTAISVLLTLLTAYPLSLPRLHGRNIIARLIFFTMLFSGGTIPLYLQVKDLGLLDTFWALVLPGAIGAHNMFILRNALQAVPASLEESARMDGANPFTILFRIAVPMVAPTIAAITLFYGLANWNSYMDGLLYTNSSSLQLLQLYLRMVLSQTSSANAIMAQVGTESTGYLSQTSTQMAIVVITVIPIMIVYPWLSRFYVSGLSTGAVKG